MTDVIGSLLQQEYLALLYSRGQQTTACGSNLVHGLFFRGQEDENGFYSLKGGLKTNKQTNRKIM